MIKTWQTVFLSALCFIIDMTIFSYTGRPRVFFASSLFYALCPQGSFTQIIIAGCYVLLESFALSHVMGADLVVMVPLGLFLSKVAQLADMNMVTQMFAVALCGIIHYLVMDYWWLGLGISVPLLFTYLINAIIVVYLVQGSRGNRSVI